MAEGLTQGLPRPGPRTINPTTTILRDNSSCWAPCSCLRPAPPHTTTRPSPSSRRSTSVHGLRSTADGEHYTTLEGDTPALRLCRGRRRGRSCCPPRPSSSPSPTTTSRPTNGRCCWPPSARRSTATPTPHGTTSPQAAAWSRSCARPSRRATPRSRPTAVASSTRPQRPLRLRHRFGAHAASRPTAPGTRSSTARPTGSTKRSSAHARLRLLARRHAPAYLRFDETQVPLMEMMRFDGRLYNEAYTFKYPKAGEPNSVVELWIADLATGRRERIDTGSETDQYIPRIGLTPDGRLWFHRHQPPPERLRDDPLRAPRRAAHDLRGARAAVCRARGRRHGDLRRQGPLPRAAGRASRATCTSTCTASAADASRR